MSQKVDCYFCGHLQTKVLPWRSEKHGEHNTRRRECQACHGIFETRESFTKAIRQPKKPAA